MARKPVPNPEPDADHRQRDDLGPERRRPVEERRPEDRHATADRPDDRRVDELVVTTNDLGIAAFVVGMLALAFGLLVVPAPWAILFGIAAIVLGIVGIVKAGRVAGRHKGLSITGIVTGALGLLLGLVVVVGGVTLFESLQTNPQVEELREEVENLSQ